MSFSKFDNGIDTTLCVYLEEVVLDFNAPVSKVEIYQIGQQLSDTINNCPKPFVWTPPKPKLLIYRMDVIVMFEGYDGGPSRTGVVAEWEKVQNIAENTECRGGTVRFEVDRGTGFGVFKAKLMVRKMRQYLEYECFRLSITVEYIKREDHDSLVQYERYLTGAHGVDISSYLPIAWTGREPVIQQMPKSPFNDGRKDVINDIKHAAHKSIPLVLRRRYAEFEAIERGLSYSDFLWEIPNYHETRISRHHLSPFHELNACLRVLKLDLLIYCYISPAEGNAALYLRSIQSNTIRIMASPPCPNTFASINHLDVTCSVPADISEPYSSPHPQSLRISSDGTNPSATGAHIIADSRVFNINVNGPIQGPLEISGPVSGDIISGSIYGGNVGGHNNINHNTAPVTIDIEALVSAALRAMRSDPGGESVSIPQAEGGRKRDEVSLAEICDDMEEARKRRVPRTGILSLLKNLCSHF